MVSFAANGTAYEWFGPQDAPVVVLIHGLGLTRHTFEAMIPALAKNHRVLSYDLLGHGESASLGGQASLTRFSEQLHDLVHEFDIDHAALIGFSLGGMINRRFAMDYPNHVSALVVLNSPHERGAEAQAAVEARAADTQAGGPSANLDVTIARWFTPEFIKSSPKVIERIRSWVSANEPSDYAACRMVLASGVTELIHPHPPIAHPTLVLTCENDTGSTPSMSRGIASEIAGAEVHVVAHLQHLGLVEQPDLFVVPVIEFLSAHIPAAT